jgi:hypothetical protein
MYYAKFTDAKLWMVKEGAALEGSLEHWMVEGRIKGGILKQCRGGFFPLHNQSQNIVVFSLSWLVVVVFGFHYTSNYIVANNVL